MTFLLCNSRPNLADESSAIPFAKLILRKQIAHNTTVNRLSQPRDTRPQGERRFDQDRRRFGSGKGRPQCTHCGRNGALGAKVFPVKWVSTETPKARMNGYPIGNQSTIWKSALNWKSTQWFSLS
uniref:Uncharacterized protein n=1 Tax=Populus alba TaxID=43335 RepID=A0A4U5NM95_POPAL|nr:hypothetical protein D5086_0000264720 [Populus alba]